MTDELLGTINIIGGAKLQIYSCGHYCRFDFISMDGQSKTSIIKEFDDALATLQECVRKRNERKNKPNRTTYSDYRF